MFLLVFPDFSDFSASGPSVFSGRVLLVLSARICVDVVVPPDVADGVVRVDVVILVDVVVVAPDAVALADVVDRLVVMRMESTPRS
ncbi:hypothetical protein ACFYYR_18655 [Streptomyces sp. NPDC001922]|uniref:hypothetical protein n=1 Tax=Streptomyces sp. NPDC001922 TaxID=3364624 RepID=UPI0036B6208B